MIKCFHFTLQLYLNKTFETNKRSICGTLVAPDNSNQSNTLISLVSDTPTPNSHLPFPTHSPPAPCCPPLPHTHTQYPDRHTHQLPGCSLHFSEFPPFRPVSPPHLPFLPLLPHSSSVAPLLLSQPLFALCHRPFTDLAPICPLVLDRTIIPRQDSTECPNTSARLFCLASIHCCTAAAWWYVGGAGRSWGTERERKSVYLTVR